MASPHVSEAVLQAARDWASWDPNAETRGVVEGWLKAFNDDPTNEDSAKNLNTHFTTRLTFGTAGLRGRMGVGTARMNELIILQTCQGMVKHLQNEGHGGKRIVIGYDHRHHSKSFACTAASVFADAGFEVFSFGDHVPTPFVPYAVRLLGCIAGCMVTASHNPKDDNGFKVYWENTAQIVPPVDEHIHAAGMANLKPWKSYDITEAALKRVHDTTEKVTNAYMKAAVAQCRYPDESKVKDRPLRVVYTAMHGVGTPHVRALLDMFSLPIEVREVQSQCGPDPEFSTVPFPNPEEKHALDQAMAVAAEWGADIVIANDPDADRLAVAVPDKGSWRALNGNEIALLLADWAWMHRDFIAKTQHHDDDAEAESPTKRQRRSEDGSSTPFMVASTVSSKVLRSMGAKEGFEFHDTLTGFKWMGNKADELIKKGKTFLFAYEVEIGFMLGTMSLDKDGIRAAGAFVQLALYHAQRETSLTERLENLYTKYGFHIMVNSYFFCHEKRNMDRVFDDLQHKYRAGLPFTIKNSDGESFTVTAVRDLRAHYDSSVVEAPHTPALPKDAYMITLSFEGGAVCTIRGSGTEPKLKYYTEVMAGTRAEAEALSPKLTEAVVRVLLKPEEYSLKSPSA